MLTFDPIAVRVAHRHAREVAVVLRDVPALRTRVEYSDGGRVAIEYQRRRHGLERVDHENGQGEDREVALRQVLAIKKWNPRTLMDDNKTISGTNMAHLFTRPDLIAPQFEALIGMYEKGEVKPHVDRSFPFAEAGAAHQYLHDRKAKGKVLLVP
jgi:D-arabinose 1-dehydrogenase-like Zn-dependent alcohol dehydrogenase